MRRLYLENIIVRLSVFAEQRRIFVYLDSLQAKADILKVLQAKTSTGLGALLQTALGKVYTKEL
jgi:hypothetical protein